MLTGSGANEIGIHLGRQRLHELGDELVDEPVALLADHLDGDEGAGALEDLFQLLLSLVGAQRVPRLRHHVLANGAHVVVILQR